MLVLIARRMTIFIASLFLATVLVFVIMNVLPGSAAQVILGINATPASVKQLDIQLGLNRPLWLQYASWVGALLTGHLGTSYISSLSIGSEIASAAQVTVPLVLLSMLIGLVGAVILGSYSALWHGTARGTLISALSQLGISVPAFVTGIVLILFVSVKLELLPATGFVSWSSNPVLALRSLILPALSLGLVEAAVMTRYVRAALLESLRSDYMRAARAKGLRPAQALVRHGARNAAIPLITVLGLHLAGLLVGAVVIENVFALPGLGTLLIQAIQNRDILAVQDMVMLIAGTILTINLLVDLLYGVIDPRTRLQ